MYATKIKAPQFRRKLMDTSGGKEDRKREPLKHVVMASEVNAGQRFWYPGDLVLPENRNLPDLPETKKGGVTEHRDIPVFVRGKKFTKP